ncbi:TetR family transcriptional regulator [Rhodococcus sp. SBT000017]|uniref:TetR/AcrR family transcriptional regulator n=1 Tax=unclassified Rhodococcus (in: high G+C Gram-positive bacteria) TaxID=192944 RepID=UPI000EF8FAA3|nr:TetR family transcriptional regulator [Rhodococcus sp. SBT000017]RMB77311.1 TetR/AcrR family transcriptional regulator [Rhodococcus sp. SBT000017]
MPAAEQTSTPGRYRVAASTLARDTALDALRELLHARTWRTVTMSHIAKAAGLSRQSLYNEFGSRRGVAQGYAIRLTDMFVDLCGSALYQHPNDARAALQQGFSAFFELSVLDPLVRSLHGDDAPEDLLRLITTDSAVLIERAGDRLAETLQHGWVGASPRHADIASKAIVRLALSYIPEPPDDIAAAADDIALLLTPFIDSITGDN